MPFTVSISNSPLTCANGKLEVELADKSGCHVDAILAFPGLEPVFHRFSVADASVLKATYKLPAGQHNCALTVLGYSYGTLSRGYDVGLTINGVAIAKAKGTLPKDPGYDFGSGQFTVLVP
jgi:hypothetical protein